MKKYHITYLKTETDGTMIGTNVHASNPISALIQFENDYPNAVFLYIASEDMFNLKA